MYVTNWLFRVGLSFLIVAPVLAGDSDRILFLHHSTGRNLLTEGNLYELLEQYNRDNGTAHVLTDEWSSPSENYPYDYYIDTFSPERLQAYADAYDVIVFKHCFPTSDIREDTGNPDINSSRKSLENYKLQYRALRDRFDNHPTTKFLIMTIPPRHRNYPQVTPESPARARQFVEWVKGEFLTENGPHTNIGVFDFHSLLTDSAGFLRYEYERSHTDDDSHPNTLANETITPLFCDAIIRFCQKSLVSSTPSPRAPESVILMQNYPNPFNAVTQIRFSLRSAGPVKIEIFDVRGHRIYTLFDEAGHPGDITVGWNGRDMRSQDVSSGLYIYRLTAGAVTRYRKMLLIR